MLSTGISCGREVDETDDNTLSVECVNSPRSRLVTAPAAECFRVLPSSAEVDDVLRTARHRHRAVACLRRHYIAMFQLKQYAVYKNISSSPRILPFNNCFIVNNLRFTALNY